MVELVPAVVPDVLAEQAGDDAEGGIFDSEFTFCLFCIVISAFPVPALSYNSCSAIPLRPE
jgi:hypothetical protein